MECRFTESETGFQNLRNHFEDGFNSFCRQNTRIFEMAVQVNKNKEVTMTKNDEGVMSNIIFFGATAEIRVKYICADTYFVFQGPAVVPRKCVKLL